MTKNAKIVNCPNCGAPVEWKESSQWRPFCCERCKLIDLGAWAAEEYSVASEAPRDMEDLDYDQPPKN